MPTVEKVRGGEVLVRGIDTRFSVGDQDDVSDELAAYLCEERGDFEIVDGDGSDGDLPDGTVPVEDSIEQGVCPWCDDYEGDAVAQHASAAHPDEWAEYTED